MNEREALEEQAGIHVPGEARYLFFDFESQGEYAIRAKLALPPGSLAGFLASNGFDPNTFSPAYRGFLGVDHGDWDPNAGPPFPVAMRPMKDGRALYVGYREGGSETLVFIFWFRT